jgi:4-aminobutyrate aminotransferase
MRAPRPIPDIQTALPGPRAAEWIARDNAVLSPSYTRDYPLVAARGEGCTIEDVDGNLFLDMTAGIAVTATGHCHPDVVAAIADQATRLIHMSGTDFYYAAEIELAERLARIAPGDEPKLVFFTNSGAESVEAALKLARRHTGRDRAIAFYGAFHGRTYGALSLGGSKAIHQQGFGPLLTGVHRLAFNCSEADIRELFRTVCPPSEVAAIFVEPIQGEGGYRPAVDGFLAMLRRVCDEHGMLLVFDEIQSGIGRTGKWFACEHWNVAPDIICVAKGLASGMPLGAIVAKADIMDWPPGTHASTFGGNPICCRAALATLDLIEHEYLANAAARGSELTALLQGVATQIPNLVGQPRGLGLMQAVDILEAGTIAPKRRNEIIQAAFRRGLLLLGCGQAGIRFCPALCVTAAELVTAIGIFAAACNDAMLQRK